MKSIAVYCGSRAGADPAFTALAEQLADAMAAASLDLVYGGSNQGLMGHVADSLLAKQRRVIGVMPSQIVRWEQAHPGLSEFHHVDSMHQRKQLMADLADGFLALPGGIGTLEEIIEMISWAQLGIHHKPCAFLNINGYYDALFEFLDHSVAQGLMRAKTRDMILLAEDAFELIAAMQAYQSPVQHHWLDSSQT